MKSQRILIIALILGVLTGCGTVRPTVESTTNANPETVLETSTPKQVSPTKVPSPTPNESKGEDEDMMPSASGMQNLVDEAIQDLADRLSISADKISLVEATEVVWPDASLGCPQPEMLYKQVPEDGAQIVLMVEETAYEYHSGGTRGVFLCEKTSPTKTEKPAPIDITKLTPQSPAGKAATPAMPDNSIPPGEDN